MRDKINAPPNQETSIPLNANPLLNNISGPPQLTPLSNEPLTIHSVEDSKIVYQTVGKLAGINVLFDPEYTSKRIQVDLTSVPLYDALRIIGTISGTFWRPITQNTIFVAANTRSKRSELDEQAVQTFYLSNAWQQNDMQDVQTALRNVMPNAKVYGVAGLERQYALKQIDVSLRTDPEMRAKLVEAARRYATLEHERQEGVSDAATMRAAVVRAFLEICLSSAGSSRAATRRSDS